jgi:hypothetical protein
VHLSHLGSRQCPAISCTSLSHYCGILQGPKLLAIFSFFNPENVLTPFIARSRQLALHNAERYAVITVGKRGIEFTCEKCPLVPQMFWE